MVIKTLQQLNDEFLTEYIPAGKTAEDDIIQIAPAEITKIGENEINEQNHSETRVPDSESDVPNSEAADSSAERIPDSKSQPAARRAVAARKRSVWKDLFFLLMKITVILLAFTALFTFLFGLERYGEPSMSPAIKDGDLVIYYRYTKVGYLAQDTIVLEYNGQKQARRVVAVAGDVVDISEDGLVINGALQQEADIYQKTERYADGVSFPLTVPEGHVFVLSDSRTGATDSRIYGTVNIDDTLGKVMAVIRRRSI